MSRNTDIKYRELVRLCEKYNAKIIQYEYHKKTFGNFVIKIEYNNKIYTLVTDRGEIFLDTYFLSNNDYHVAGHDDTFSKILELLRRELFEKIE